MSDLSVNLHEALVFWQDRLRLRDWNINLVVGHTFGKCGQARKLSDYKEAEIQIPHPEAMPASWLGNRDPEVTLVHELLHLQGEGLDDFIARHKEWEPHNERLVELTAIALVELKRKATL
jgi:hypothetical protein